MRWKWKKMDLDYDLFTQFLFHFTYDAQDGMNNDK